MAPEIALMECRGLRPGSVVFDPMVGSGTTIDAAISAGCTALGSDVDPLAVLMSSVRTTPVDTDQVLDAAMRVADAAASSKHVPKIDSVDGDPESAKFVDFWFAGPQQDDLRRLAAKIAQEPDSAVRRALQVAFSRLIITKDKGASLGRDVSHSRPHRVRTLNDYDVLREFRLVARKLATTLASRRPTGHALVFRGDARSSALPSRSVDLIITSPPYLNAIDYLRGHRLSLVWLGYPVSTVRAIRSESIGSEKALAVSDSEYLNELRSALGGYAQLAARHGRMVDRYLVDLDKIYAEQARVLRPGGHATTVIGNSALRGAYLENDQAAIVAASKYGLKMVERVERPLHAARRYLPPPRESSSNALHQRMRGEIVLRFQND